MALLPMTAPARFDERFDVFAGAEMKRAKRIDAAAIAAITDLYREILPPEIPYSRIVGVGVNARELAENPFLDEWCVQDLNRNPCLPCAAAEFDGAAICVSVQHLTRPCEVFREVGRVLKPGAPLIVTFSNRCLPTRAIACWCLLDDAGHLYLIAHHFAEAGNWSDIRCLNRTPPGGEDPLCAVIGRSLGLAPRVGRDQES